MPTAFSIGDPVAAICCWIRCCRSWCAGRWSRAPLAIPLTIPLAVVTAAPEQLGEEPHAARGECAYDPGAGRRLVTTGAALSRLHDRALLRPDLLLTSFAPAEIDGYHPGFAVAAMLERVPILFMSGLERAESVRRGLIFPWALYLRYPAPPGVLCRTVRKALVRPDPKPLH